jgi:hypothetical protein
MTMTTVTENRRVAYDPTKPRLAEPDEIEEVMTMCRHLHRENGIFPLDEVGLREDMLAALNRQSGIVGVMGSHHKLEAIMYLMLAKFRHTREMHLEEIFSYVPPNHRKSTHAKLMIEWAKEMADGLGVRLLIGIISTVRTEAKVRLYRRQLGAPVGAFFLYGTNKQVAGNGTEH